MLLQEFEKGEKEANDIEKKMSGFHVPLIANELILRVTAAQGHRSRVSVYRFGRPWPGGGKTGWTEGRTEGRTKGRTEGRTDRRADGRAMDGREG